MALRYVPTDGQALSPEEIERLKRQMLQQDVRPEEHQPQGPQGMVPPALLKAFGMPDQQPAQQVQTLGGLDTGAAQPAMQPASIGLPTNDRFNSIGNRTPMEAPDPGMQIGEGNPTGMGSMPPVQPGLTGSAGVLADIRDKEADPGVKENSFGKRIGRGLKEALGMWAQAGAPGGLAGLVGALGTGAGIFGASPGAERDYRKQKQLKEMWGDYNKEAGVEKIQNEQVQGKIKTAKADHDLRYEVAKPYIDSALRKGYLTDEEIARIKGTYGIDITDPNNAEFVEREVNGKWIIRRKNSPEYATNTSVDPEIGEQYRDTTINTGGGPVTLPLKPGQAASTIVGVEQANSNRAMRASETQARTAEKEFENMEDYSQAQTKARAQKAKASTALKRLQQTRAELAAQELPTTDIDRQMATFEGEVAEADELLKRKPPKRGGSKGKKKYSTADIERVLRQ